MKSQPVWPCPPSACTKLHLKGVVSPWHPAEPRLPGRLGLWRKSLSHGQEARRQEIDEVFYFLLERSGRENIMGERRKMEIRRRGESRGGERGRRMRGDR